jgi:sugar/nucleoside kinase (ribokinase family)
MTRRRGVLSAGTYCVDFNKSIARWPVEDTSNEVFSLEQQGGGSGYNMAVDLKRLDPDLPVEAMGVVGDDDFARYLFGELDARDIPRSGLVVLPGGATMSVDGFNNLENGRRTHFFHQGVASAMNPDHFDFSSTTMRRLHLGLPGAHQTMDRPWSGEANGWVATLRKARAAGLKTDLELMTISAERIAALGRPCLPHLDTLIVNDFEIGALTGRETRRRDGSTDIEAVSAAIGAALDEGAMDWAVAHFPEGAVAGGRDGTRLVTGSVAMPPGAVKGVNGAGDAFSAGMLYGLESEWPIGDCLLLAHSAAAASMRRVSTTEGVGTVAECLALAQQCGLRPITFA